MKNDISIPPHDVLVNSKTSADFLAELRKQVITLLNELFGFTSEQSGELYDTQFAKFKAQATESFYTLDAYYLEASETLLFTLIHVIDKTQPLSRDNLLVCSIAIPEKVKPC